MSKFKINHAINSDDIEYVGENMINIKERDYKRHSLISGLKLSYIERLLFIEAFNMGYAASFIEYCHSSLDETEKK